MAPRLTTQLLTNTNRWQTIHANEVSANAEQRHQTSALNYPQVLTEIRDAADRDVTLHRLFIRCLSPETTSATLHSVFSPFGIIHEAVVIYDRVTERSKCFGFITFKHVDAAILAMRNPSRRIDGRMTVTQVASAGVFDNVGRKIFVENVPFEISSEELLNYFLRYGEIEEGPIGFDSDSGRRTKGFAFFVYKTDEAAQAAVCVPVKMINGHRVNCKIAIEHRRPNQAQAPSWAAAASSGFYGDAISGQMLQQQPYLPQFGGFRGISPMLLPPLGNSFGGGSSSSRGGQT
ncbi:hypothetical protein RIF29_41306 [Crotalaria pallida]|uniref:RRM domain-containing protein n=1 Tax=Crotalaria pallida TaxID=3830 RepID=A0AAN9HV51_CROPI